MGDRPFPLEKTIAPREVAYYKRQLEGHAYGTPLDPRHNYTKSDWLSWAAALSASDEDFQLLFDPESRIICAFARFATQNINPRV